MAKIVDKRRNAQAMGGHRAALPVLIFLFLFLSKIKRKPSWQGESLNEIKIINKRDFIKQIGAAAFSIPVITENSASGLKEYEYLTPNEISSEEDFWLKLRSDYELKSDYINLESGYCNIIPSA